MGIEGNELTDIEAKRAAAGDASPAHTLPSFLRHPLLASSSATKRAYNKIIAHRAAEHLAKSKHYPRLRAIDATVPSVHFWKLTADLTRYQYAIRKDTLKPVRNSLLADSL